ncbi:hypothetical protein E4U53_007322 [Claviceps sorghi]|nr:hypothetical protein E4U53_007322 [Claviceps sorghi]
MRRIARPVAAAFRTRRVPSVSYATTPRGPTSQFYKTFTRPVAKVLVLAVFTYQFAYWGWAKLEADEHQRRINVEIAKLEARVRALDEALKEEERAKDAGAEGKPRTRWW